MLLVDQLVLVTGLLLLLGIVSSKFSSRVGVPVLVLFLLLGMLAGSEGIGGIPFENYTLAHGIGTIALVLILFDGGLSTRWSSITATWKPSLVLATLGVLLTTLITAAAATLILGLPFSEGMLLGSIVGSTDAAAVFAILRSGGIRLPDRLGSTLELESGSNDPMAVFLTITCVEVIAGRVEAGPQVVWLFAQQMVVGAILGALVGRAAVRLVNVIRLEAAGLYPVLVMSFAFLSFGLAALLGGSGFLAAYIAGIVIGNQRLIFQRGIFVFHDAGAWLSQIVMFVVLGLLSFPSRLLAIAGPALLIALVLMFVARPVAVLISLLPFRFARKELLFLSWGGLKGAVPITLATFPLMYGIADASQMFDVIFFVVLLSAAVQGWTLPVLARRLGLQTPSEPKAPLTLEISSLQDVDGDIVDYLVGPHSRAAGHRVRELALPEGVVIAVVARDQKMIPPHGDTEIREGDHVILVLRPELRRLVDRVFAAAPTPCESLPSQLEFPLRASTTAGQLHELYGITVDPRKEVTLAQVLAERLAAEDSPLNRCVAFGEITLWVREVAPGGAIVRIGMVVGSPTTSTPGATTPP